VTTRILIVDDSSDLLELYEIVLSQEPGYEVRCALSVDEAISIVSGWRPDVVISDIVMPRRSGLELITWLRSNLAPPVPPIVALSGFPDVEEEALRRGAMFFEVKPVEGADLVSLVAATLERQPPRSRPAIRSRASARRSAAAKEAEAVAEAILARHPDFGDRLRTAMRYVATYFGGGIGTVLLLLEGHLRVLCSSHGDRFPNGANAHDALGRAADVIESGSSLVVPCAGIAEALGIAADLELRPIAIVPLFSEPGVVFGGAAVFGAAGAPAFDAADLRLLEHLAHHGAVGLTNPARHPLFTDPFVLRSEHWRAFLRHELAHLAPGRSMGLAMIEVIEEELSPVVAERLGAALSPRTALGRLDSCRFGLLTLGYGEAEVRGALTSVTAEIAASLGVHHSASLIVSDLEPPDSTDALLGLVEATLRTASRRQEGTALAATLKPEATPLP
jgi:CheY-like chemotaxis protein